VLLPLLQSLKLLVINKCFCHCRRQRSMGLVHFVYFRVCNCQFLELIVFAHAPLYETTLRINFFLFWDCLGRSLKSYQKIFKLPLFSKTTFPRSSRKKTHAKHFTHKKSTKRSQILNCQINGMYFR